MNFIEELFYGNINPNGIQLEGNSQYEKAMETFDKCEDALSTELSGENLKLFNRLIDANGEIDACLSFNSFKMGFILGVQMMTDCFKFDADNFLEDK